MFANTFDRRGFAGSSFGNFIQKREKAYLEDGANYTASIVNTAFFDPASLGQDWRGSIAIRDPRDIVVSGYFYHRKGLENFTRRPWESFATGPSPIWTYHRFHDQPVLPEQMSLMDYLNEASVEDGMIAEIKLRQKTFDTIQSWLDLGDDRLKIAKYEEIMGDERAFFRSLGRHYGLSRLRCEIMGHYGYKHAAGRLASKRHVRDPSPRQWEKHFTPRMNDFFHEAFPGLVERLGYDV